MANNNKQQSNDADKLNNLFNKFDSKKSVNSNESTTTDKANTKTNNIKTKTKPKTKADNSAAPKATNDNVAKAATPSTTKDSNPSPTSASKEQATPVSSDKATATNNAKANTTETTEATVTKSADKEKANNININIPNKNIDQENIDNIINDLDSKIKSRKKAEEDLDRIARGTGSVATKNNQVKTQSDNSNDCNGNNGNGNNGADNAVIGAGYSPKRNKLIAALAIIGICLAGYATYQVSTLNIDQKLSNYQQKQEVSTVQSHVYDNLKDLKQQVTTLQNQLNQTQAKLTETETKLANAKKDLEANTLLFTTNQTAEKDLDTRIKSLESNVSTNNNTINDLHAKMQEQAAMLSADQQELVNKTVDQIIKSDEYKQYLESIILDYLKTNPNANPQSISSLSQYAIGQIEDLVNQKLKPSFEKNTAALEASQQASQNAQSLATQAHNIAAQAQADASQAQALANKALDNSTQALSSATQAKDQANKVASDASQALATSTATQASLAVQSKALEEKANQVATELKAGLKANTQQLEQVANATKVYAAQTLINQYLDLAQALIRKNAPAYQVVNQLSIAYDLAKTTNPELANSILADVNYFQKVQLSSAQELATIENELNQLSISSQDLPSLDATKFKAEVTKDASAFDKGIKSFIKSFVKVEKVGDDDFIKNNAGILVNQTIQLKLNQALFALQNNNADLYHSTLKEVINLLDTYYQNNDAKVKALRKAVEQYLAYDFSYNNGYSLVSLAHNK